MSPQRSRGARVAVIVLKVVAGLIVTALLAGYLVAMGQLGKVRDRTGTLDIKPPASAGPLTWLVVGEDLVDTATVLPGGDGTRADVVILITQTASGMRITSIPRDILVRGDGAYPDRLTMQWLQGPQHFVDAVCKDLGIPVNHLVRFTSETFAEVIDSVGGIDVTLPYPLRDKTNKFNYPAGTIHLNGAQAVGFARTRMGEAFINGTWVSEPNGPMMRQRRTLEMYQAVFTKVRADPKGAARTAYRIAPDLAVDQAASWLDLVPLLSTPSKVELLPAQTVDEVNVQATDQTRAAIAALGYHGCTG